MDQTFKWTAVAGIVLVSVSIAYYLLWFLPSEQRAADEQARQARIVQCEVDVKTKYTPGMDTLVSGIEGNYSEAEKDKMTQALNLLTGQMKADTQVCETDTK